MNDKNPMSREEEALKLIARQANPSPSFTNELEKKLMNAHKPKPTFGLFTFGKAAAAAGWAVGLAALILTFIWVIRSLAPQPQPAAGGTPVPTSEPLPTRNSSAPGGEVYERFGQTVRLQTKLPDSPSEAAVYLYQPEQRATLESARALAAQFGMEGAVYKLSGEIRGATDNDFLVVDGNRRLQARSDQVFSYFPDFARYAAAVNAAQPPDNAEAMIEEFMTRYSFGFPYKILLINGYYLAAPLTPDGHIICYEYFACAGLRFTLDEQGILAVDAHLPKYETQGQYSVVGAEEAFHLYIDPALMDYSNAATGMLEGMIAPNKPIPTWLRARPLDQTLTLYGYLSSVPSAEGGQPLVTLDGMIATGNIKNIPAVYKDAFVRATGQLHEEDGVKTFALEKWEIYTNGEEGLFGAISQQGDRVILNTSEGEVFTLPDVPADLPLPLDNAFVIGVRHGETFDWRSIDQRNAFGGGGGGGGGLGFYKLNLTGTPVSFPTPVPRAESGEGGGQTYIVQENDTLAKIADQFGVEVAALMQANGLDEAVIFIGQTLVVPASDSFAPQKVEGLRGTLSITIYKQKDGSQRAEYNLFNKDTPFPSLPLEGENLEELQAYQNRPVDIWGTIEMKDGSPVLTVERYEVPYPDLQFQILRGKQRRVMLEGQQATLFTADDGKTYVQLTLGGYHLDGSAIGQEGDEILIEALIIPDETLAGYPVVSLFSASTADAAEPLTITADQIYVVDLANEPTDYAPPTLNIEGVELVYYMPDPRNIQGELSPDQRYIQPAWRFTGHYSTGEEFFILVQALKREFFLPEFAPFTPPG